jgi:hypothetical protein
MASGFFIFMVSKSLPTTWQTRNALLHSAGKTGASQFLFDAGPSFATCRVERRRRHKDDTGHDKKLSCARAKSAAKMRVDNPGAGFTVALPF